MTTKLYFHSAANALSGTFPTGEQAPSAPSWSATGASTLRTMDGTKGVSQASLAGASVATVSAQNAFMGFFCSPALSGAQTVGGGRVNINVADSESNTNMNFLSAVQAFIYVWRPSTGASVGTVCNENAAGVTESTAASSEQVSDTATGGDLFTVGVSASDGDVIIFELWSNYTQGMATSYTGTVFYDGTTENTTENAVVSNHAGYIQFAETLTFKGAISSSVGASSGTGAATGVGASTAASPGSSAGTGSATGVGRGLAESVGSASGTGSASASGTDLRPAVGSASGVGAASATGRGAAASVGSSAGSSTPLAIGRGLAESIGAAAGTSTAAATSPAATTDAVGSASGSSSVSAVGRGAAQAVGAAAGTSTVDAVGADVTPIPGPTIYYQGAGHPGKHLRRRKRVDLFDSIEATLRESVYGPDEPDEPTPELKPATREAVSQLEEISEGNADLLERLAVLKAEMAEYRRIQAEKEKLKRLELIRQQEEDDEEAWLMVA